jgi:hypothetical protein
MRPPCCNRETTWRLVWATARPRDRSDAGVAAVLWGGASIVYAPRM